MAKKMDLDEYLGINGVGSAFSGSSLDKCRFPHGLTEKAHKRMMKDINAMDEEYYQKRAALTAEYNEKVANGEFVPRSNREKLILKAKGHPDLESVQAARRICAKKGIDWEHETVA